MEPLETEQVLVALTPDDVDFARQEAQSLGVRLERVSANGIDPVTAGVIIVVGASLAVASFLKALDQRKGGQVIDLRAGARRAIYRDRNLLYGSVVIWTDDGKVIAHVKEPDEMFTSALEALKVVFGQASEGTLKSEVAQTIAVTLGSGVEVAEQAKPSSSIEGGEV